ncbi:MAG TPA: polyphosphate kinase 1 [Planctomycetota bacterium]|nr:polyphosphate kinase 1 [Planctomycetota bacterium]
MSRKQSEPPQAPPEELFFNRELSLLEFNRRVLQQARDPETPLLERLRFLTICSTNLDEFFEIRVSGLKQQVALGVDRPVGPENLSPADVIARVSAQAHALVAEQYRVLNEELLPALAGKGIHLIARDAFSERQAQWLKRYFRREVQPVLTPMAIDPAHPFPRVLNKSLNFLVSLHGTDAFGRHNGVAVVNVPRSLPRLIPLPQSVAKGTESFVMLSSVIHAHVHELFPGMEVVGCYQFRVTRNSDLWVEEEEVDDLLQALEGELPRRNYGDAVRLELADTCPPQWSSFLREEIGLAPGDLYQVNGPVNLHRLAELVRILDHPELKYPPFRPGIPRRLQPTGDVFAAVRRHDVLLHHPYESFAPIVDLLRQAARDRDVLAIKQTLYRTGEESELVDALIQAARAGKEVTVVVELRARFDERANIDLATRLQEAGAHVVYGVVGYKTHAKLLLVVRREGKRLRRYAHLGTGNYHARTARQYADVGLFTCDPDLTEDVHHFFLQLTGMSRARKLKKLLQAPFTLLKTLLELIEDEAREARAGRPARIVAKMNALTEPRIIQALYAASQAGVEIELIVRGACCLRPGVPGISDNIRVSSLVGRFLEHHRVFLFHAAGAELVLCSSADFMQRNFYRRVEACFPIEDEELKRRVIKECLTAVLKDNVQTWLLQPDGTWVQNRPGKAEPRCAQSALLEKLSASLHAQLEPDPPQHQRLGFEVRTGEGLLVEPPGRELDLEEGLARPELEPGDARDAPAAVEEHGEPQ